MMYVLDIFYHILKTASMNNPQRGFIPAHIVYNENSPLRETELLTPFLSLSYI
jgi:hypothetical protein